MNTERITLIMKEQKMNDILVKLISGEIKTWIGYNKLDRKTSHPP